MWAFETAVSEGPESFEGRASVSAQGQRVMAAPVDSGERIYSGCYKGAWYKVGDSGHIEIQMHMLQRRRSGRVRCCFLLHGRPRHMIGGRAGYAILDGHWRKIWPTSNGRCCRSESAPRYAVIRRPRRYVVKRRRRFCDRFSITVPHHVHRNNSECCERI